MARLAALAAVLAVAFALASAELSASAQFKRFMTQYKKSYANAQELSTRFGIFQQNLALIAKLNRENPDATFAVNKFADMTPAEFKAFYLGVTGAVRDPAWPVAEVSAREVSALPDSFDWRPLGAVTPVKNQGQCGSCWSFSTTGNIEGQWFLANHSLPSLSEQNLVDCDHECMKYENQQSCDAGCNGGLMPNAFTYVIKNGGIDSESSYPYEAVNDKCRFKTADVSATISNFTMLPTDEDQIAAYLVAHGPVSIAADAVEWQFYTGGVFRAPCGKSLDHGILLVGFGHERDITGQDIKYWWVKNSWGADWGIAGYLKIERGVGKCGLNTFACSAIV